MRARTSLLLLLAAALAAPAALAGTVIPATPTGEHCINVNTDTCSVGGFVSTLGWGYGFEGVFEGTYSIIMDGGGVHHEFRCHGVLAGILEIDVNNIFPECDHIGNPPPTGVPITMTCETEGTGVVACSITEFL